MKVKISFTVVMLFISVVGCMRQMEASATPSPPPTLLPVPSSPKAEIRLAAAQVCNYPAHWFPYQVQPGDTIDILAVRFNTPADQLFAANCLPNPSTLIPGMMLYVPALTTDAKTHTILPLGISAFAVEPAIVQAGGTVRVTWQGQGAVASVRAGWLFNNQFVEETRNLPTTGAWDFQVPADGRDSLTLMLRVGDGVQEVAAQSVIRIMCLEGWYFAPSPTGCPTSPLTTTFHEQHFERGTLLYIPALGVHYVLIVGQAPLRLDDAYIPGMPLRDGAYLAPEGFLLPSGSLYYAWRQEGIRQALGYAIDEPIRYMGMMQRSVDQSGSTVYLMASSGHVYQAKIGASWGVIVPG